MDNTNNEKNHFISKLDELLADNIITDRDYNILMLFIKHEYFSEVRERIFYIIRRFETIIPIMEKWFIESNIIEDKKE